MEDKWESALWILNADGSQHRFLVKGSAARWSPDGKRLLYLAEGEPKGAQLFVRWVDADGPATQITHVVEAPRNARWSPDGKSIAFSMFVADQEKWTISMPTEPKGAKWTPAPRVVGTMHYRQDQVGFLEDGFTHLFVVPAEGGTPRQLTTGKWSVGAGELRGGGVDRLDARQQVDRVRRQPRGRRRHAVPGRRSCWSSTSPPARSAIWSRKPGVVGPAGRVAGRPDGRLHRPSADRATRTRSAIST